MTGESAGEEINVCPAIPFNGSLANVSAVSSSRQLSASSVVLRTCDLTNVLEAGDSGPVSGEDSTAVGVDLALEDDAMPCSLKAEVDASDAAEEAADAHN